MKRNVTVAASSGGVSVELVGRIDAGVLTRQEVERLADDLRDRLMQVMPDLRYTNFRLSKLEVK